MSDAKRRLTARYPLYKAVLFVTAERVLKEQRRLGHAFTRHAAFQAARQRLEGAVRVGAMTAEHADAEARRAVLTAETEPVRLQGERMGVLARLEAERLGIADGDDYAGTRVECRYDENGIGTITSITPTKRERP